MNAGAVKRLVLVGVALFGVLSCGGAPISATSPAPLPAATATFSPSPVPSVIPTPAPEPTPSPSLTPAPVAGFTGSVIAEGGGRIRSGPGMDQRIVALEAQGSVEIFDGWYRRQGDVPQADLVTRRVEDWSRDWYRLADGRGWMHATVVNARPPAGMLQVAWQAPKPAGDPGSGRRIVISVVQQHLWALDGDRTVVDTVVATGRPELTTLTGRFSILRKYSPYLFVSPWPPSSPYWYPPSWTNYAMEFEASGYFIHDAPWRSEWGPGANLTSGTHGCVNVPTDAMRELYAWAVTGDLVVVTA